MRSVWLLYWSATVMRHVGGGFNAFWMVSAIARGAPIGALVACTLMLYLAQLDIPRPPGARKP